MTMESRISRPRSITANCRHGNDTELRLQRFTTRGGIYCDLLRTPVEQPVAFPAIRPVNGKDGILRCARSYKVDAVRVNLSFPLSRVRAKNEKQTRRFIGTQTHRSILTMIKYYDALVSDISDISQPSVARAVFAERLPSLFQYLHFRRSRARAMRPCL